VRKDGTPAEDAPGPPPEAAEESERARIRRGVAYCLGVFLGVRVALAVLGLLGTAVLAPYREDVPDSEIPVPVDVPGWPAPETATGWSNTVTAWERFDALWFLRIADRGYDRDDGSAVFFPLYPMTVRAASVALGGHPLAAGLLVSNAAFAAALMVLYFLTASELSERAARRAVLYVALFPAAFFFLAPYSESLFLLLSVTALWAARRRRWPVAGIAGGLAALTRSPGVLLAPALAVEAVMQWREQRRGAGEPRAGPWPALAWSALPVLGLVGYLAWWGITADAWRAPFDLQDRWLREVRFPLTTLWDATRLAGRFPGQFPGGYHLLDWMIVVPCLVLAGYAAARFRPTFTVYAWASIVGALTLAWPERPLMSMPRFLAVLFPVAWSLADLVERGRLGHGSVVAVSAGGLGIFAVLFVNWYFIF
jgi:hypothetical protein